MTAIFVATERDKTRNATSTKTIKAQIESGPFPDQELLDAFQAYQEAYIMQGIIPGDIDPEHPNTKIMERAEKVLATAQPKTLQGLAAKLVFASEWLVTDGLEDHERDMDKQALISATPFIVRLADLKLDPRYLQELRSLGKKLAAA